MIHRHRPARRPWLAAFVAALLLIAASAAWAQEAAVTDCLGRAIDLDRPNQRIVCLGPGALRLIVYLGAHERVVGVEALERDFPDGRPYILARPELTKLPVIGPGGVSAIGRMPDMEALLAVAPQLIFVTYMDRQTAQRLQAQSGAQVVALDYGPFASVDTAALFASLRVAGAALGRRQRAEEVIAQTQGWLDDLARRAKGAPDPGPVYVGGVGFKGVQGLESSDADYAPFTWLGLDNAAKLTGGRGHCFVGREKLLTIDPPTIFMDAAGMGLLAGDWAKRPEFYLALSAFGAGRVFVLHPFNWYVTNLGVAVADAYAIGRALWPRRFADVEPEQKAAEIHRALLGVSVQGAMAKKYGKLGEIPAFIKKGAQ